MQDKYEEYSREELLRLLRERDRRPRFGLVWERDEIEHDRSLNDDFVVLETDAALSVGEAPQQNLVIEGDNFDVLRYLRMTHAGKVKCIYIDPPYNTGNRDFIYNDRFIDKDDAYRHSKWLEYMYRRLVLAKDLLAEDGVIFVSINDIELAPLKLLLDRTFGEKNCLANLVWHTDGNFDNQARFKVCHEYILVYAANEEHFPPPPVIDPNADDSGKLFRAEIRNTIVKNGPKNPISDITLPLGFPADFEAGVITARTDKWPHFLSDAVVEDWKLAKPVTIRSGWANKTLCEKFVEAQFKPVLDTKNQPTIFVLTETGAIENVKTRKENQSHVISVIKNVGSVQASGAELVAQGFNFPYPKPVGLIQYLLRMITGDDYLVLDFFAGSGTTAHAVMKLNAEDGGNRRFILVSSTEATTAEPDRNICRDVCAERLRRVIRGYANKKGDLVAGLGGAFRYLRTRRIPASRVFNDIQHGQVWLALQMIHGDGLADFDDASLVQVAGTLDARLVYVPKLTAPAVKEVAHLANLGGSLTVFSWQPGQLRQRIDAPNASFEKIPEFLVKRFGGGK